MSRSVALLLVFALIVTALAAPSEPKEEENGQRKYKRYAPVVNANSVYHEGNINAGNGGAYYGNKNCKCGSEDKWGNEGNAGYGGTIDNLYNLPPWLWGKNQDLYGKK